MKPNGMSNFFQQRGFTPIGLTLAELLIALAILGVIATFTIPKILDSGSDSQKIAIVKEAASMISGAYQSYKLDNTPAWTTLGADLTPYMNFVRVDSTTNMGAATVPAGESTFLNFTCADNEATCLELHNGAYLGYEDNGTAESMFLGTTATHSILFHVDPDGPKAGAGAITIALFFNGRITTGEQANSEGVPTNFNVLEMITTDPPWFSWSS